MQIGPIYRKRQNEKNYIGAKHSRAAGTCPFCSLESDKRELLDESTYFVRIKNLFPYDMWDGHETSAHELLVPKRHVTGISALTTAERQEMIELLCEADKNGYSYFARHDGSTTKTVLHQHTHLIKITGKPVRHLIYFRKPHILLLGKDK